MGNTQQAYAELMQLRNELRREYTVGGREPKICPDESVMDMAVRLPAKRSDLLLIKGIGETFADKYGDRFLRITKRYICDTAKSVPLTGASAQTLRDLEKKLINISRGNPLLFNPKLVSSRTFDLTSADLEDPLEILFGNGSEYRLCGVPERKQKSVIYSRLNEIIRESIRNYREKGTADLYIAYPFVIGHLTEEEFPIYAPLALFPVTLTRTKNGIFVMNDDSRDCLYNTTFILSTMRFGGLKRRTVPDPVFEPCDRKDIIDSILGFYSENGITIKKSDTGLIPFREYRNGIIPESGPGELELVESSVIGRFPLFSNSIQKDFDELISKKDINKILNDLISSSPSERNEPLSNKDFMERGMSVSEKDISYINAVNSAQEQVMAATEWMDELVVQGPPGTGKSQVITNLITTSVDNGRTVLMVSEKKTALDVVYSRLGHLSKYVMMIDDVSNKDLFYDQLKVMLALPPNKSESAADIRPIAEEIDSHVNELTRIADGMFAPGEFGVEPYRMYSLVKKVDLNDPAEHERYVLLKENISTSLMSVGYPELISTYERFKDRSVISSLRSYYQCLDSAPWIAMMKRDLTVNELMGLKEEISMLAHEAEEWNSKDFVSKLFSKGQMTRAATSILNRYFTNYNTKNIEQLISEPEEMIGSLDMYDDYSAKLSAYESMNRLERTYGENIISVNTKIPGTYDMSNDELFTFIVADHLKRFESENRSLLEDIENFEYIRTDVDDLIAEKRSLTRDRLDFIFRDRLSAITDSKMIDEIKRVTDSRRKWSVNKFIGKFGQDLFRGIQVWLMTPEVVSELLPLDMGLFDLLIFDEASQMYVEKGLPSIYRAKKVVIAGDHRQLRPSSLGTGRFSFGDEDPALDEDSLLDLARSRYDSILLNFHYRSRYEELIAFSNYAFYGGRLYVSPNIEVPDAPPIETHLIEGARWDDGRNVKEARAVVDLLKDILRNRKNDETVGIITFNASQRDLINDMIDDDSQTDPEFNETVEKEIMRTDNGEDIGLFLKNIESVQGDERDIIIFSVGYAKNDSGRIAQRFGWLNNEGGENRLNVAISRAKKKVHIMTSFLPEELDVSETKNAGPRYLKSYLEYAFAVSSRDSEKEKAVLGSYAKLQSDVPDKESIFNDQICSALRERGYDAEKNVGIGGYTIDVAVKKGSRYVLGIECDNSLYVGAMSTRERDYHRQKYLESRGWKIRRVWSSNWWNDPSSETEAIIREIESI